MRVRIPLKLRIYSETTVKVGYRLTHRLIAFYHHDIWHTTHERISRDIVGGPANEKAL